MLGSFNGSKKKIRKEAMDAVDMVKVGVRNHLLPISRLEFGDAYAYPLVAAVMNTIFSEMPSNEMERHLIQGKGHIENIQRLIEQVIKPNDTFKQIITDAVKVKCKYSFSISTKSSETDIRCQDPINKLNHLGLLIPNRETPTLSKFILDATAFMQSSNL